MFTAEQRVKVQKITLITIIVLALLIIAGLSAMKIAHTRQHGMWSFFERTKPGIPVGFHECISTKDNSVVYSRQPCKEDEQTIERQAPKTSPATSK